MKKILIFFTLLINFDSYSFPYQLFPSMCAFGGILCVYQGDKQITDMVKDCLKKIVDRSAP